MAFNTQVVARPISTLARRVFNPGTGAVVGVGTAKLPVGTPQGHSPVAPAPILSRLGTGLFGGPAVGPVARPVTVSRLSNVTSL